LASDNIPRDPGGASLSPTHGDLTLATLLNILWRRKWIVIVLPLLGLLAGFIYGKVVTPLYRATATIRPGITAFTPDGGPIREWRLKDITHWFQSGLYQEGVEQKMGWSDRLCPPIKAEFILKGLQNIQGGNVVTLTILDPDPGQGIEILEAAITAFGDYACADSISSQYNLTRSGIEVQIAGLRNQKDLLVSERQSLDLDIAAARAESTLVESELARVDLEMEKLAASDRRCEGSLAALEQEEQEILRGLEDFRAAIGALQGEKQGSAEQPADPAATAGQGAPDWLAPALLLGDAHRISEIVQGNLEIQKRLSAIRIHADSLRNQLENNDIQRRDLQLWKDYDIANKKVELHRKIENLRLERDQVIPNTRADLANQIREKRIQLATLSPVERVGHISATAGPVRPRKMRAMAILTLLGLLGSLVLAFTWDYVSRHRDEIFRS